MYVCMYDTLHEPASSWKDRFWALKKKKDYIKTFMKNSEAEAGIISEPKSFAVGNLHLTQE